MFRLHTASLHQAMKSTGYAKPYKARCSAVIGWCPTTVIGAFRSSLFRWAVLSAVRFFAALLLLCFLIVGIYASEISIPLSLLMLKGWSRMRIASLTLRVYQCGSRSINFTSSTSGLCPVFWACSETSEHAEYYFQVWFWSDWVYCNDNKTTKILFFKALSHVIVTFFCSW